LISPELGIWNYRGKLTPRAAKGCLQGGMIGASLVRHHIVIKIDADKPLELFAVHRHIGWRGWAK
jgi:hypothetical protein